MIKVGDIVVNPWVSEKFNGKPNPLYATIYLGRNETLDFNGKKRQWADKIYKENPERKTPWEVIGHIDIFGICNNAILSAVSSEEPTEYSDYISRQELLNKMCDIDGMEGLENSNVFATHYVKMVKSMKPVSQMPKMGRWIWEIDETPSTPVSPAEINYCGWVCDHCHNFPDDDRDWDDYDCPPEFAFCPNCGTRMIVKKEV